MSFNYHALDLPSRFVPYPELKGKIGIRTMIGADEEKVMLSPEAQTSKALLEVIQDTLEGVDDITKLTDGDTLYVILWHAINSYSPEYPVNIKCESCLKDYTKTVDLRDLNVDILKDSSSKELILKLPKLEKEIIVRCPTTKDGFNPSTDFITEITVTIYDMLNNITHWNNTLEKEAFDSRKIPVSDLRFIAQKIEEEYKHGPSMLFEHTCPSCKKEQQSLLPFRFDYIVRTNYAF
jgi:hypothetical protein